MANTLTYDESGKGWTSFHSFIPDWMQRLNNRFFTVKGGQLYLHNDEDNAVRNNFYGVQYPTTVKMIVNDFPSEVKFAKTIMIEGNKAFDVDIKSYLNDEEVAITETTLGVADFLDKEGLQHAFFRQSTLATDYSAKNAYGLGRVNSVLGSVITLYNDVPLGSISIGDTLLDENENTIGVIQSYSGKTITVDTTPIIIANTFVLGYKNAKIEGSAIRGYNFEVELTDDTTSRTELFAVNFGIAKSHPS
jgi:hypothetical protein